MGKDFTKPADFEYLQGIHLVGSILWLDAPRLAELCFVSSPLLRPAGPHQRLLLSERCAELLGPELDRRRALVAPFYQRFVVGGLELQLAPSGHMPGAAQLLIGHAGRQLLYLADCQPRASRCAEPMQSWPADRLLLKAHYGLPGDVFPDPTVVGESARRWTEQVVSAGEVAVFFYLHPATALELLSWLRGGTWRPTLHRSLLPLADAYRRVGVSLPEYRRSVSGRNCRVVLWPWHLRASTTLGRLGRLRRALVSGEAARPGAERRWQVERAFCLSCRADRRQLLQLATASRARRIYLSGRRSGEMAAWLRQQGLWARVLAPPRQLELFGVREPDGNSTDGAGSQVSGKETT